VRSGATWAKIAWGISTIAGASKYLMFLPSPLVPKHPSRNERQQGKLTRVLKVDRISGMSGLTGIRRSLRFGRLISGQAVRRKIRDAFGSAGIAVGQYDDRVAVLQEVE